MLPTTPDPGAWCRKLDDIGVELVDALL